jgi:antitoxin ParD1/3/4
METPAALGAGNWAHAPEARQRRKIAEVGIRISIESSVCHLLGRPVPVASRGYDVRKGTSMPNVTISLPEPLRDFVDRQMTSRGFGNVSEYFRTLLREAQEKERETRLEELLLNGLISGEDIPLDGKFWKDLRAEALEMIAKRKPRRRRK